VKEYRGRDSASSIFYLEHKKRGISDKKMNESDHLVRMIVQHVCVYVCMYVHMQYVCIYVSIYLYYNLFYNKIFTYIYTHSRNNYIT